jgi:ABC-type transport system substrate-binding protein
VTKNGIYAYGSDPELEGMFQAQAKEQDRKKREAQLHQIQKIIADQALIAPIFQQGFIWGVSARVAEPAAGLIEGFAYVGPAEDVKLK